MAEILVAAGADVDVKDKNGFSPFCKAHAKGYFENMVIKQFFFLHHFSIFLLILFLIHTPLRSFSLFSKFPYLSQRAIACASGESKS